MGMDSLHHNVSLRLIAPEIGPKLGRKFDVWHLLQMEPSIRVVLTAKTDIPRRHMSFHDEARDFERGKLEIDGSEQSAHFDAQAGFLEDFSF
jgi:hypothetical protein